VTSALAWSISAFLPIHFQLEAGASLPLRGAQRGDQHHPRQRELDERPQSVLESPLYDGKIDDLYPVIMPGRERLGFAGQRG